MKKLFTFSVFIMMFFASSAQFIYPPILQCPLNILPNGDVELNWLSPVNTCGPFIAYKVFVSSSENGTYIVLGSVGPATASTYTHVGANGNAVTYWYYMESDCDCPGATVLQSDTISTIDSCNTGNFINDLNSNIFNFSISPNPTSNFIRCSFSTSGTIQQLLLRNLLGEEVLEQPIVANQIEALLDLTRLPAGIYLLEALSKKGIVVQKVVKE